jgi:hypothetical protein
MNQELANKLGDALIEVGKKFKAGTSDITEDEAIDIFSIVAHQRMSREQVCDEMNINDTKFYNYLTLGKIPKGKKQRGFKELYWWKDEIHAAINKLRKKD